jgi:hypothetical protein
MLNALPAPILLDIAIIFTALSWGLGLYLVDKRVYIFASLAIGCFVCLFGYSVESVGAPPWQWSPPRFRWICCYSGMS